GMLAESELDTDPSSSSYELKAITETHSVADSRDSWENDEEAIPFNGSGDARVDPARSSLSTAAAPWETPAPSLAVWPAACSFNSSPEADRRAAQTPSPAWCRSCSSSPAPPPSSCWSIWAATSVDFGKDRFAELAPEPILEPPLPGRALSPVVTSRPRNIWLCQIPPPPGKGV